MGKMSLKCASLLCPTIHLPLSKYCHNTEALNHSRESVLGVIERRRCGEVDEPYRVSCA